MLADTANAEPVKNADEVLRAVTAKSRSKDNLHVLRSIEPRSWNRSPTFDEVKLRTLLRHLSQAVFSRRRYKFLVREFIRADDLDGLAEILACTRHLRTVQPILMMVPLDDECLS